MSSDSFEIRFAGRGWLCPELVEGRCLSLVRLCLRETRVGPNDHSFAPAERMRRCEGEGRVHGAWQDRDEGVGVAVPASYENFLSVVVIRSTNRSELRVKDECG